MNVQPLTGIRIVDLTRILSGPFCTMMLGDMGADVVKVEDPPGGDPVRDIGSGHNDLSWYFASFNRNKRSICLDLRSEEGREALRGLLSVADVLVENFRPGVLEKIGFGPEELEKINPRLIVASINGFGSTGPYADRPAFDFVVQAMSGFMSVTGERDGTPLRTGLPITDLVAGVYTAFGIVSALRARDLTNKGQRVEASMMNGIISMMAYLASEFLATGEVPTKQGNDHPITSPYGLFTTANGPIAVAPSTDAIMRKFLNELGLSELLEREEFSTNAQRLVNREALNRLICEKLADDTQENWVNRLNAQGVPCGVVQDIKQALHDPQVLHQEMVLNIDHPGRGLVKMLGFPVKLSETPCQVRRPAPELGAHAAEVFEEWNIPQPAPSLSTL